MRCTVFLKGCPLRCAWCHNPEGLSSEPETMRTAGGTRQVGRQYSPAELAERLLRYSPIFDKVEGGVTFSGGEPLFQANFLSAVLRRLKGKVHTLVQTSGYAPTDVFVQVAALADLVYFDLKIMDSDLHRKMTGVGNEQIQANLLALDQSRTPYRLRVPLAPGITDTPDNYRLMREFISSRLHSELFAGIDLLPYNIAAGGKYEAVGRKFSLAVDPMTKASERPDYFKDIAREVKVL